MPAVGKCVRVSLCIRVRGGKKRRERETERERKKMMPYSFENSEIVKMEI